jgi:hypothetical protein
VFGKQAGLVKAAGIDQRIDSLSRCQLSRLALLLELFCAAAQHYPGTALLKLLNFISHETLFWHFLKPAKP